MNLEQIIHRTVPAIPWTEGENIPWNDPDFSERMLAEHLNQGHDLASRRSEIIDRHVRWIHECILESKPTRILDLTCGPGLYTTRLARLGHHCVGIDFAPAAIRYAQEKAMEEGLSCEYRAGDVRQAPYGDGYGLVMMLFGQINVFRREDARAILSRARSALETDGQILLEPQRLATVQNVGRSPSSWYSSGAGGGLFSPRPHLCLTECFWDSNSRSATQRFFVIDAVSQDVARYAMTTEGYTEDELERLLCAVGFSSIRIVQSLKGPADEASPSENFVMTGRKDAQPGATDNPDSAQSQSGKSSSN